MMTLATGVGLAVGHLRGPAWGVLAALTLSWPYLGVPLVIGIAAWHRYRPSAKVDVGQITRLVGVALRAGHSLNGALDHAHTHTSGPTRAALGDVLRRSTTTGLGPSLASTSGPLGPFGRRLAGAHRTGASATSVIDGLARELTEQAHAERLARVRRLPVQLTIPLVLLILPGSVLLLIGPAVVAELLSIAEPLVVVP